jgi:triosephosphate isomerase
VGGVFTVLAILLSVYCYRHLPLIDFLPYKVSVNISQAMEIPENAPQDEYETILIYEKPGEGRKTFTLENYPQNDTTWKFIESVTVLKKKGYQPPITDFRINDSYLGYITDSILNMEGYLFILTMPHIHEASLKNIDKINKLADYVLTQERINFIALAGSDDNEMEEFITTTGGIYPVYFTDEKPLKSMVRANPGLLLLHNGTIIKKWSHYDIPSVEKVQEKYLTKDPEIIIAHHNTRENLASEMLGVLLLAAISVVVYCFRKYRKEDADSA